jgi:CRP-like cAMP-binding protein
MQTVRELREHADRHLFNGNYLHALHAYTAIVELQPANLDARLRVADALLSLGQVQRAAVVYTTLARHAGHAGYPLRALVALKILTSLEPQLGALLGGIAELYGAGSPRLGRATRFSPGDPDQAIPPGLRFDEPPPAEQLAPFAEKSAASLERIAAYPEFLPAIPLFSELPGDAFARVLAALKLVRCRAGEAIIREGEPGHAFFVIARGSVRVTKHGPDDTAIPLATLSDGSIFGEMALVSASPRTATVTAAEDCDLLEFDREALAAASREVTTIAAALDKFTRERLLNNLLATSGLFKPLDRKQRYDLVRRFTAHDVAAGTDLIHEGQKGRGLFVLLAGEVDVWKRDGDEKVLLATLHPGDVFGEISLLNEEPTTASVSAARQCTVLFLAREFFQRLVQAVPEIKAYVEQLGEERQMDTRIVMSNKSAPEAEELTEDDLILI